MKLERVASPPGLPGATFGERAKGGGSSKKSADRSGDWAKWSGARDVIVARDGQPPRLNSLEQILEAAARHPFYAGHIQKGAPLEAQPILTKAELYQRLEAFGQEARPGTYWSPSGGTGGRSIFFPTDVAENRYARVVLAERLKAAGVFGPDQVCVNLAVTGYLYRTSELFTDFGERAGAAILPVGNEIDAASILDIAAQFHANSLCGAPNMMVLVAGELEARGEKLALDSVITGADTMYDAQRAYVREHTGAKHFAEIFGSAECGVWAYKPPSLEGTRSFVFDPKMVHVEIVDADADGYGRIVVTHLIRKTNPLVRYDTGDVGRLAPRIVDGKKEMTLEFAGRAQRSFQLRNDSYDLDFLESSFTAPALQYQVVLSHHPKTQMQQARLSVVAPVLTAQQRRRFTAAVKDAVPFDSVSFVGIDDLERLPRSRKIPAIVDHRGR